MPGVASAALLAAGTAFALPTAVFGAECLLGALPRRRPDTTARPEGVTAVVLIPAHDEAVGIGSTVAHVRTRLAAGDRVLVVADNCSDETADVARAAGAEVIERHDNTRRGKGFALAYGFEHLRHGPSPPDVVIVLDADCAITPDTVHCLVAESLKRYCPVQADNTVIVDSSASASARVSAFAFRVRNRLRPRGLSRLGLPCHLAGTGMALPFALVTQAPDMEGHLAEDLAMGIELGLLGFPAMYTDTAAVTSELAPTEQAKQAQRQRWEHGHLSTQRTYIPRLLRAGLSQRDHRLLAMALDLTVPPLAFHVSVLGLGLALGGGAALLGTGAGPALLFAGEISLVSLGVLAGWWAVGTDIVSPRDFLAMPTYVVRKIPSYWAWLRGHASGSWVRAQRNPHSP